MNILLLQFKNYFDRKIKRFENLSDYMSYQLGSTFTGINFIPGDGVETELILNFDTATLGTPDYLIAAETNEEFTRWFVMNSERTRKGQTKFKLRRDLIAEEIEGIKNATSMIKKGYCEWGNVAFFNKEPISVNSIPKSKDCLIDNSVSGWIVAYLPKHSDDSQNDTNDSKNDKWEDTTVKFGTSAVTGKYSFNSISAAKTAMGDSQSYIGGTMEVYQGVNMSVERVKLNRYDYFLQNAGAWSPETVTATDYHSRFYGNTSKAKEAMKAGAKAIYSTLSSRMTPVNCSYVGYTSVLDTIAKYNGKTFTDTSTGLVYMATLKLVEESINDTYVSSNNNSDLYTVFLNAAKGVDSAVGCYSPGVTNINWAPIRTRDAKNYRISVTVQQLSDTVYSWTIDKTRRQTKDAPYDCICMPYRNDGITASCRIDDKLVTVDYEANMQLASALSAYYGSSVYDVQLLPYCPVQELINPTTSGGMSVKSSTKGIIYKYDETSKTIVFYCDTINTKFTKGKNISPQMDKDKFVCDKYKLVAPNYSSEYEIPVFENHGIYSWNITQTLIPYSPWIQIVPVFNNFNGTNLNDSKGLIVGGSLSITQTSSAWAEYLRTNSNYSQIFESQMAYQEYQQKNSMVSSALSAGSSALTTGVTSGIMTGNVGVGIAAGVASGAAGIADLFTQNKMNQKANEYTREQYNLQLGNIKSTPATISKVTSINSNFAVWPYIETDSCTDAEKEIVKNYLKNYGMTINQVGQLGNFMDENYYCSADIILADDIKGDANYKNQIKTEVGQGFFYEEE